MKGDFAAFRGTSPAADTCLSMSSSFVACAFVLIERSSAVWLSMFTLTLKDLPVSGLIYGNHYKEP